jgi:hypothetical protein
VQIAMVRFSGPGISTVCRAKLLVVSTVFEPKMNLPDAHPHLATISTSDSALTWIFLSPWRVVYRIYLVKRQQCFELTAS